MLTFALFLLLAPIDHPDVVVFDCAASANDVCFIYAEWEDGENRFASTGSVAAAARRRAVAIPGFSFPQMTGTPLLSRSTVARGESYQISIPITTNTRRVTVSMGVASTGVVSPSAGSGLALPVGASVVEVVINVPSNATPGRYYPIIELHSTPDPSPSNFSRWVFNPFLDRTYLVRQGPTETGRPTTIPVPFIDVE